MKKRIQLCEKCNEETIHSNKKVFSSRKLKIRRAVERCNECGKTIVKNSKKGSYTKKLGGRQS